MTIRKGTLGRVVDVDGVRRAALFDGARARVLQRLWYPDGVVIELLDDGPGGNWYRGQMGEIPMRYFVPDRGKKPSKRIAREVAGRRGAR